MSDETSQNGQENTSTQTGGEVKKVELTQEELNALINKKYASGAEKAKTELLNSLGVENVDTLKEVLEKQKAQEEANKTELEKLQEQLEAERVEKEKLANSLTQTTKQAKLNKIAAEHGIEDVDYLEYQYDKQSKSEEFDVNKFIEGFVSKNKKPPNVDNTSNRQQQQSLEESVKGKTLKELEALANAL